MHPLFLFNLLGFQFWLRKYKIGKCSYLDFLAIILFLLITYLIFTYEIDKYSLGSGSVMGWVPWEAYSKMKTHTHRFCQGVFLWLLPVEGMGWHGTEQREKLGCHHVPMRAPVKSIGPLKLGWVFKSHTKAGPVIGQSCPGGMTLDEAALFSWAIPKKIDKTIYKEQSPQMGY